MPGSKIGSFTVVVARAEDDVWAHAADGRRAIVALGSRVALAAEARAIAALAGKIEVAAVIEEGDDARLGDFLALDGGREDARSIDAAVKDFGGGAILTLVEAILGAAATIEDAGYRVSPREKDVYARTTRDGFAIGFRRLRGAGRLGHNGRLDARAFLDELAPALLSDPSAAISPALARAISGRDPTEEGRTVEAVRASIERARAQPLPEVGDATLAAFSDLGLLREKHEDAAAIAHGKEWAALAVCDGVSASYRSDLASRLAADRVCARLRAEIAADDPVDLVRRAIREAHEAICDARVAVDEAAGTTVVAALVRGRAVSLGWVGDSRAYWVGEGGDMLLTRDHSWLNDVLASGILTVDEAIVSPNAHALTRCLGPLEGGDPAFHAEPDVYPFTAPGAGWLILCTDGLWNYFPTADDIGDLVRLAGKDAGADRIARVLVHGALSRGGHDNVTVAVLAVR